MTTYTVEEVAGILKISEQTVRNLIKRKELKAIRVGGQFRITKEELDHYLQKQST
jgi:putative molybdopterin biosynthesis protein